MKNELFYLNHKHLNDLLGSSKLSHKDVAKILGVSTKTIQRMKNEKSRRFPASLLNSLAELFNVSLDYLIVQETGIRDLPSNPLIDTVTSDKYFEEVQAKENWAEYIQLLRRIPLSEISTHQEAKILSRLGASYLFSAQNRFTKSTLEKAEKSAILVCDSRLLADIYVWQSIHQTSLGDLKKALDTINRAEEFYKKNPTRETLKTFETFASSYRGYILGHMNRIPESEINFRRALRFLLLDQVNNRLKIARIYSRLGGLYLKKKDYRKAHKVFLRSMEMSKRYGWPKGVALSKMAIGIISNIEKGTVIPDRVMSQARLYYSITSNLALDTRFEQFVFVYKLLADDYQGAAKVLIQRRKIARHSKILSVLVTLDKMFFARMSGRSLRLSSIEKRQAKTIFINNDMTVHLKVFEWLLSKPKISRQDLIDRYIF